MRIIEVSSSAHRFCVITTDAGPSLSNKCVESCIEKRLTVKIGRAFTLREPT